MSYKRRITDEESEFLSPIREQLDSLAEGEGFSLRDTPSAIDELRNLLYTYFSIEGIKSCYRIRRESPISLRIVRIPIPRPRIVKDKPPSPIEEFVLSELIHEEKEEEVLGIIHDKLAPESRDKALAFWKEVSGNE